MNEMQTLLREIETKLVHSIYNTIPLSTTFTIQQ